MDFTKKELNSQKNPNLTNAIRQLFLHSAQHGYVKNVKGLCCEMESQISESLPADSLTTC